MHELPRSGEHTQITPVPADMSSLADIPAGNGVVPVSSEITAPGTTPSPQYMDPQRYIVDMRGPGHLIDRRALPEQPETPPDELAPPALPDRDCLHDMRGPDSGLIDMRSWRYLAIEQQRREEQPPAPTE